ncbi:MAG: hypothetical protein D3M94_05800 [Rhodocyclales bacterium GT-UBC]|nr:MAG: hypothetical protein D3M94_05800 [Rhodocyclales bacterium GT-UBC]
MNKSLIALALIGAFAAPAFAEEAAAEAAPASPLSFNVGVVSDYVFRGISQSQHQPALQGGVDYAHASGFYVGSWASTIEWTDRKDLQVQKNNRVELDIYGGYKGSVGDFGYDVGAIRYFYNGEFQAASGVTANTTEVYVGGSWKFVSLKYNHVVSNSIFNWGGTSADTKTQGSGYYDLTVTYPVDETLNLIAHVGRQNIKNLSAASYTDWKLGVTKDFGIAVVGLAYTDTNAKGKDGEAYRWAGKDASRGVVALSVSKTF